MNQEESKEVKRIMEREKVRILLYPIVLFTTLYGIQYLFFPGILETYRVYSLIGEYFNSQMVGIFFILMSGLILISYAMSARYALLILTGLLMAVWSMFTVAFILSPPPNTVWISAAIMTYLSFNLARRV